MQWTKKPWIVVCLIVVLGLGLRLYGIGQESYWLDEGYTLMCVDGSRPLMSCIIEIHDSPPLYFIFLRFWTSFFGTDEVATRSLSVLFGGAGIIFIYLLGREASGHHTGLLAALFSALSLTQVTYSQDARMYSLFFLLAAASCYSLVLCLKGKKAGQIAYFATTSLIVYTHYLSWILIIFQLIVAFILKKERRMIFPIAGAILLLLPWLPYQVNSMWHDQVVMRSSLTQKIGLPPLLTNLFFFGIPIIGLGASLFISSVLRRNPGIFKRQGKNALRWLAPIMLGIHFIILPMILHPIFFTRYLISMTPLIYLGAAASVMLWKPRARRTWAMSIILLSILSLCLYYILPTKEQWGEATNIIPAGSTVIINDRDLTYLFNYYSHDRHTVIGIGKGINLQYLNKTNYNPSADISLVKDITITTNDLWYVESYNFALQDVEGILDSVYPHVQEYHLTKIKIRHYWRERNA